MTIEMPVEPPDRRDIVHAALTARLHRSEHLPALAGSPQIGAPLPVYLVEAPDAASGDPLAAARQIGWRYPVIGGASPGLAFLRQGPEGPAFAGLSHGELPRRLLDASLLAQDNLGASTETYQPRLLEIPSLRLCALWLAGPAGQDFFVPLLDGHQSAGALLQIERDIKLRINAAWANIRVRASVTGTQITTGAVKMKATDMRLAGWVLAILIIGVPFAAKWVPGLHATAIGPWMLELLLIMAAFATLGIGGKSLWFGIVIDGRNKISLSRLQIVAWTILFTASFFVLYIWNGSTTLEVPSTAWLLMGMSGISAAGTPIILSAKAAPDPAGPPPAAPRDSAKFLDGIVVKRKAGETPKWSDLILGDEAGNADSIDISKVQQLLLSGVAIVAYGYAIALAMMAAQGNPVGSLPKMDENFLALIGASHATYLLYKSASHSN